MSEETHDKLSAAGGARRERILQAALGLAAKQRRRRRHRKIAVAAVVAALVPALALATLLTLMPRKYAPLAKRAPSAVTETSSPPPARLPSTVHVPARWLTRPPASAVRVERIAGDPRIIARYASNPLPDRVERIDDAQLLATLRDQNLRGGLIVINGQERLILSR